MKSQRSACDLLSSIFRKKGAKQEWPSTFPTSSISSPPFLPSSHFPHLASIPVPFLSQAFLLLQPSPTSSLPLSPSTFNHPPPPLLAISLTFAFLAIPHLPHLPQPYSFPSLYLAHHFPKPCHSDSLPLLVPEPIVSLGFTLTLTPPHHIAHFTFPSPFPPPFLLTTILPTSSLLTLPIGSLNVKPKPLGPLPLIPFHLHPLTRLPPRLHPTPPSFSFHTLPLLPRPYSPFLLTLRSSPTRTSSLPRPLLSHPGNDIPSSANPPLPLKSPPLRPHLPLLFPPDSLHSSPPFSHTHSPVYFFLPFLFPLASMSSSLLPPAFSPSLTTFYVLSSPSHSPHSFRSSPSAFPPFTHSPQTMNSHLTPPNAFKPPSLGTSSCRWPPPVPPRPLRLRQHQLLPPGLRVSSGSTAHTPARRPRSSSALVELDHAARLHSPPNSSNLLPLTCIRWGSATSPPCTSYAPRNHSL